MSKRFTLTSLYFKYAQREGFKFPVAQQVFLFHWGELLCGVTMQDTRNLYLFELQTEQSLGTNTFRVGVRISPMSPTASQCLYTHHKAR